MVLHAEEIAMNVKFMGIFLGFLLMSTLVSSVPILIKKINTGNITFNNTYYNNYSYYNATILNNYDQDLNTTSNVTFNTVNATNFTGWLNWSWILNVPSLFNYSAFFNQSLNTTDNVTFNTVNATTFNGNLDWTNIINAPPFILDNVTNLTNYYNTTVMNGYLDNKVNKTGDIMNGTLSMNNTLLNLSNSNITGNPGMGGSYIYIADSGDVVITLK